MKKPQVGCRAKTWLGDECQCDCIPGMQMTSNEIFKNFVFTI